ncbi:MAG: ABC transporter substrate-binding protein [Clostridiales bacterium]|jgi:ABC-type Fe3+-hydroxamate transport system substrate-binding protein|nr:ABC transporter substrate-binding protein [Clostridiales bacterium]
MKKFNFIFVGILMLICTMFLSSCNWFKKSEKPDEPQGGYDRETLKAEFLAEANKVVVNDATVVFQDASGKASVTVAKNPSNVVNLYASFTTLWYEAGGTVSGLIGGASSVSLYEEQIGRDITNDPGVSVLATSSSGSKWSTETIIASNPGLIICSTAMSGYATIGDPAETVGIPVIAVSYDDFSDYLKWFKVFCNLSGHPELWETVALDALDEVIDILMQIPLENNPLIFSMFSGSTSLQANLSGTVVGAIAKQLRATNIADSWQNTDSASRLPINLEYVFAADPELILVQCHEEDDKVTALVDELYGENPIWNNLSAVKNGKVYYLPKTLFHNKPNKKFAEAYRIMAQILYPEIELSE